MMGKTGWRPGSQVILFLHIFWVVMWIYMWVYQEYTNHLGVEQVAVKSKNVEVYFADPPVAGIAVYPNMPKPMNH